MTIAHQAETRLPAKPRRNPPVHPQSLVAKTIRSGFAPAALTGLLIAVILPYYGVAMSDVIRFSVYIAVAITLPGSLWWRFLRGRAAPLPEDIAAGTALGYAMEVLSYIPARAAGHPLLFLLWPAGTLLVFAAVPRLRRHWRGSPSAARVPLGWAWAMAAMVAFLVLWSALVFYRTHGLTWPSYTAPTPDQPYHLALAGELKHHMPPVVPYLIGEPLHYHWFAYAEMAATSWATGTELFALINRLSLLPMIIAFTILIAMLGRRLSGRWWGGLAAVGVTYFAMAPDPYRWPVNAGYSTYGYGMVEDGRLLRMNLWISPTQTFGAVIFAAAMLVLVDLLRGRHRDGGKWLILLILLATVMGGKSTYLPMLMAGLGLVVLTRLIIARRPCWPALLAVAITGGCLLFAEFVLFGGDNQGLVWAPTDTLKNSGVLVSTQWTSAVRQPAPLLMLAGMFLLSWTCIWPGLFGLLKRPLRLADPALTTFLGIGAVGIGAVSVLGHPGLSQFYFFQSARPYLAIAAVTGAMTLFPAGYRRGKMAGLLAAGLSAGIAVIVRIRMLGRPRPPRLRHARHEYHMIAQLMLPYLLLAATLAITTAVVVAFGSRHPRRMAFGLVFLMALSTGSGLPSVCDEIAYNVHRAVVKGWRNSPVATESRVMTAGTIVAGRWLRDHSSPDDLIATNAHCRLRYGSECDDRHFWISGFTERRVLLEGWGYTARANDVNLYTQSHLYLHFWDPALLRANDAAFLSPSASTVGLLRAAYGVTWLFVDSPGAKMTRALDKVAWLRFRSGNCLVYQVPPMDVLTREAAAEKGDRDKTLRHGKRHVSPPGPRGTWPAILRPMMVTSSV